MNKDCLYATIFSIIFCIMSCQNKKRIYSLLNSNDKNDVIIGAYLAGESGKKEFAPLLLKNAWDERTSTNIQFKGFTVYQEKMIALKKIYKKDPPNVITYMPDSSVIHFFTALSKSG